MCLSFFTDIIILVIIMNIEEEIFNKYKVNLDKLIKYGFTKEKKYYKYSKHIINNKFIVNIFYNDKIYGNIYDVNLNEEYVNYRIKDMVGEYVSTIREEYKNILLDIRENCFTKDYFLSDQANRITNKLRKIYGDLPDYPWQDSNGVFRNNNKWYALIMEINKKKLDKKRNILVNILNVKLESKKVDKLIDNKSYFRSYHMNKNNWITILLDESLDDNTIIDLIKISHSYTEEIKEWIIPSSNDYGFDIVDFFNKNEEIIWHQNIKANIGDVVYIYAGKPYSAILYKSVVEDSFIPNNQTHEYFRKFKYCMRLKIVKKYSENKYPFKLLNKYGILAIRGQRRITKELSDFIKSNDN